jgi:hypothetical protein
MSRYTADKPVQQEPPVGTTWFSAVHVAVRIEEEEAAGHEQIV